MLFADRDLGNCAALAVPMSTAAPIIHRWEYLGTTRPEDRSEEGGGRVGQVTENLEVTRAEWPDGKLLPGDGKLQDEAHLLETPLKDVHGAVLIVCECPFLLCSVEVDDFDELHKSALVSFCAKMCFINKLSQ